MEKQSIISKIYNDPSGFGSQAVTLKEAKEKYKTITKDDVKDWFIKNLENKKQLEGTNSFIAPILIMNTN